MAIFWFFPVDVTHDVIQHLKIYSILSWVLMINLYSDNNSGFGI